MESLGAEGGRLEMDEQEIRKILGDTVQDDSGLLDEYFEIGDLQAIAQWMIDRKEKVEREKEGGED